MVFSSITFLFAYLPAVLLGYYVLPRRWRFVFLFAASMVFYAWGEPIYALLMAGSILINWCIGLMMERYPNAKKAWLIVAVVIDLLMIGVFKYAAFLINSVAAVFPQLPIPSVQIRLPIGISFFTFQIMSYVIDVYRGDAKTQHNIIRFGTYVSMYPQLIAGPIVRYVDIEQQLDEQRLSTDRFADGVRLFIVGLSKKLLLANAMGTLWNQLSAAPELNGIAGSWIGLIAYSFQIYFDFSGYSDMACGLGDMLGFTFVQNFRYPYMASSITDFWRRWHISLGTWFREYVYIPLGGNRHGIGRQLLNIFIVWALTGLWHGASWNFVVWGVMYAVLLMLEKAFLYKALQKAPAFVGHVYTLFFVCLGWGFFCFTDFSQMGAFMKTLFTVGSSGVLSVDAAAWVLGFLPWLAVCALASTPLAAGIGNRLMRTRAGGYVRIAAFAVLFLLCVAALASQSYNPFIYFRF